MATPAFHVACAYVGSPTGKSKDRALITPPVWSEHALAASTTSTNAVPAGIDEKGDPVFQMVAAADSYVSIGPSPNAGQSPRLLLKANEVTTVYCKPGDKVAWVAA